MTATEILTKVCNKCGECKPATADFFLKRDAKKGTLKYECRKCAEVFRKAYYAANKTALIAANKAYREKNKDSLRALKTASYQADRENIIAKNLAYRAANREAHRARVSARVITRTESDPVYAMRRRVSALISVRLRAGGYTKKSRSNEILGCSWEEFKNHIERQFLADMSWENRGRWQLDHIVPISTATTESEVLALSHHTNLRPLWSNMNRAKSDVITHLI
jgi:hypothetical protein